MHPKEFINTIYLGDRFCKNILIDGYSETVKIQVNMISRIRNTSGEWQYYNDENIEDGLIVFTEVDTIIFEPNGLIPNDEIEFVDVKVVNCEENKFIFELSATSCNKQGECEYGIIKIVSRGVHLENPANPGVKILD
jgi:hypothetical protein